VHRTAVVAVLGATLALAAGLVPALADSSADVPVFGHPVTVDAQRMVGEPDGTVGHDGRIYVSGPWGVSTGTSFIWRSEDDGESFRQIQAAPGVQNPYPFRAGGDTEVQAFPPAGPAFPGEQTTGTTRLYFANQNNLDSNSCGYSDDGGRSFTFTGGAICPQTAGADREWITETRVDPSVAANDGVLDHDISYLWYDHYENGGNQLWRSDNGQSYTLGAKPTGVSGNPGNIVADRKTGVVYMTAPGSSSSNPAVAYSADGGKTTSTVQVPRGASTGSVGTDFAVLAIDTAGNLYLTWANQNGTGEWRTWYTHTTGFTTVNNGVRDVPVASGWATPVPVTGVDSQATDVHYAVFPWVTAGDPGRVDLVYYGTTKATGYNPNSQNAQWHTYMAQTVNGLDASPSFTTVDVAEAPTHLASICFSGIGCTGTGNRNLLDFFEVRTDNDGAAVVIYNDDANSLVAAFPGGPQVMVSKQVGGPSVYNSVGTLAGAPTPPTSAVSDGTGDGTYPTTDANVSALDLTNVSTTLSGSTLDVSFTVKDLANAVRQIPPAEAGTGITYVLSWKKTDATGTPDLYFAAAHVDPSGTATYVAGRPQSVPFTATGGPKFISYGPGQNASTATGAISGNTITMHVPASSIGSVKSGDLLLQATGFSIVDRGPFGHSLGDQADATRSFDTLLGAPSTNVPESTWVPALALIAAAAVFVVARRRRTALPH
jgi:hypothetical protein